MSRSGCLKFELWLFQSLSFFHSPVGLRNRSFNMDISTSFGTDLSTQVLYLVDISTLSHPHPSPDLTAVSISSIMPSAFGGIT